MLSSMAMLAIAGSPWLCQGDQPVAPDTQSRVAQLCRAAIEDLDRRAAFLESKAVTYAVSTYGQRNGERPEFNVPPDAESPDRLWLCRVAIVSRWRPAFRVHEQTVWAKDAAEIGGCNTYSSDGGQFFTRWSNQRGGGSNLMLDLRDSVQRVGPEMDAYGWRVLGQVAPLDYQYFLAGAINSANVRIESQDGESTMIRWNWLPDAPQTELWARFDTPSGALRSIQFDVYTSDTRLPGAKLMHRRAVEFMDYHLGANGVRGARIVEQLADAGEEYPPGWAVVIVAPVSMEPAACTAAKLFQAPTGTDIVQDTRFDIAYRLGEGDRRLNLDGRLLEMPSAPSGDVGWELDRWVKDLPEWTGRPPSSPDARIVPSGPANKRLFDAGNVMVADVPARIAHDFVIHNDSGAAMHVKQLVKSCGCLTCEISSNTIAPGGDATLAMAMSVPFPGPREQTVTVLFDGDKMEQFTLRAHVCVAGSLRVISNGFAQQNGVWSADVRAYWVEAEPHLLGVEAPALALEGAGASLRFDGWSLIEPAADNGASRPRRLFGRGRVELSNLDLQELRFITAPARHARLDVIKIKSE